LTFDRVVKNGLVFDGRGGDAVRADVGIVDGRIAAVGPELSGREELDATGCWVTPGFVDMHTHYDAEVEIDGGLSESVRHGVTTVLLGSCSLSMVMGDPEALADMFCRVEGIPRSTVLPLFRRIKSWDDPRGYLDHLDTLPLGPNVACLLGHSTMRAAAMGLGDSLSGRRPTAAEMATMEGWLTEALDCGYVGLSISTLPWDKMDGEAYRSRPMPSVFATWREYRRLNGILRARGRVLQAVPNLSTKVNVGLFLLESMGLVRKPLKTTLIAMLDVPADRYAFRIAGAVSRLFNRAFGADFKMQALPEPFDLWADGVDIVVFEEFAAGTAAIHLQDAVARGELLKDETYRREFRRQWENRWLPRAFHRDLRRATVEDCPDPAVVGKTFAELAEARGVHPVDAFLDLVVLHGPKLRWTTVNGNDRPRWLEWILAHPDILVGFSDAGAHLRNMAHYSFPLRMLKRVRDAENAGTPFMTTGRAVQRLTSEIADWLGLDAGTLAVGKRADLVVVDPAALDERLEAVHEAPTPGFDGLNRLVRRNDDAVPYVLIGGRVACRNGVADPALGREKYGDVLRVGVAAAAAPRHRHASPAGRDESAVLPFV
jgi:N-acyl-D-aspartate/D-glutamate deacylase